MKEKLLITGASGFLGYHLIEEALLQNYEVFAAVRKSSNTRHLMNSRAQLVEIDMSDTGRTRQLLEEHDITNIVHGAAVTKAKTVTDYTFSNAVLTRNLAQAAVATGVKKFVFISSLAALGPSLTDEPVTETNSPRPVTLYGKSKLLAETYLAEIDNFPFIGLRPTAVYGPREKDLLLLIKSVSRGIEMYIGDKEQQLSFVYVKDLAQLTINSLRSGIVGEFYNISDGKVYSRYAFAAAAKKEIGVKTFRLQLPLGLVKKVAAAMDVLYRSSTKTPVLNLDKLNELTAANWACNIEKSRRDLNFNPHYDLARGMAETVQWYKKNNWL